MKKLVIIFAAIIFTTNIYSQLTAEKLEKYKNLAEKITRSVLTENKGYNWLKELCEIGPRLSGSENSLKAIFWAKSKMEEMGLENITLQPVMVPHWERGNIEKLIISSGKFEGRDLNILALGGSIGTDGKDLTANVIELKNFDELEIRKDEVKGKFVFFSRPVDKGLLNTFAGYGGAVDQRVFGAIEAAKYDAVGVLIRSVTTGNDNIPHTGVMYYKDSVKNIPGVALGYQDADFLHEALLENPELQLTLNLNCKNFPDAKSYNLYADIKGTENPDEIVLVGGHFDSWDVGCGAHDDGAACMQSLEVLDLINRFNLHPKRTIRCMFFINEENGSRGSHKYAEYSDSLKLNHIAAIESDRGVFTPKGFSVSADSSIIEEMQNWIPILEKTNIDWIKKGGSGADVSKIKDVKAYIGYVPDTQRYFDLHHSPKDTFDKVHPREMELGSAAMAVLCYLISEEGF